MKLQFLLDRNYFAGSPPTGSLKVSTSFATKEHYRLRDLLYCRAVLQSQ